MDNDRDQAMFTLVFLLMLLVPPCIHTINGNTNRDFPRSPALNKIPKSAYSPYAELFYWDSAQSPRRRLLEHPRWMKQAYRSNDYSVIQKRHQPRHRLEEGRSYHSAVKNDEDEDEDEEEEEEEEEEEQDEADEDEKIDEEAEETGENADEEETVNEEPSEVYDYG